MLGQLRVDARVLFVGDHKQLSPPVFTKQGEVAWSASAFERLIKKGYQQTLLNVSYRSHKILYHPTSAAYYDGQVKSFRDAPLRDIGVNATNPLVVRLGDQTWTLPGLSHFVHLDHIRGDTQKDPSGSLYNPQEAELGVPLARGLLDRGVRDILVMSPYRAQVALVQRVWELRNPEVQTRPRIQTVDASQGSEADAVIVLITRNFGLAGFLQSSKRTNVMLSSCARIAQYVVGNWILVGSRTFKDSGKFYTYLDKAERVLDEADVYAIVSQ